MCPVPGQRALDTLKKMAGNGCGGQPIMIQNAIEEMDQVAIDTQFCSRAGFLPVPLALVPLEGLADLELYLRNAQNYSLYVCAGPQFGPDDRQRLLDNNVEFVYVSVQDHQRYYQTVEKHIGTIIADPKLQLEKRAQILYNTSVELAGELLREPLGEAQIGRAENIVRATVKLIIKDSAAFTSLFNVSDHDFYTATHLVNVCALSVSLAQKIGLADKSFLQQIGTGALLHDIGKMFIPSDLLNCAGPLTEQQKAMLKTHVERGCEHLQKVADLPAESRAVVAEHHERIDGTGYPLNLKGEQISVAGRIAAVVDTFDAMTSVRPYRHHTFAVEEALKLLEDQAPEKFDREIVTNFNTMIEQAVNPDLTPATQPAQSPAQSASSGGHRSRRTHERHYFRISANVRKIKLVDGRGVLSAPEKLIAHNVSACGVGLLSPRPFVLGENIYLSLVDKANMDMDHAIAMVVRCCDHGDGWFTIGARFHQLQAAEIIDQLRGL